MVRSFLFAMAVGAAALAAQPAMAETAPAQCEAMNVRVYFSQGSATLDAAARDVLRVAERQMATCDHAELHINAGADALSQARGQAILAAMNPEAWDVARVETTLMQRVSAGPAFLEVTMTPDHVPATETQSVAREAGV